MQELMHGVLIHWEGVKDEGPQREHEAGGGGGCYVQHNSMRGLTVCIEHMHHFHGGVIWAASQMHECAYGIGGAPEDELAEKWHWHYVHALCSGVCLGVQVTCVRSDMYTLVCI